MAFAMQWPNGEKGKRNDLLLEATGSQKKEYDKSTLSRARYVLRNNPIAEVKRAAQARPGILYLNRAGAWRSSSSPGPRLPAWVVPVEYLLGQGYQNTRY